MEILEMTITNDDQTLNLLITDCYPVRPLASLFACRIEDLESAAKIAGVTPHPAERTITHDGTVKPMHVKVEEIPPILSALRDLPPVEESSDPPGAWICEGSLFDIPLQSPSGWTITFSCN